MAITLDVITQVVESSLKASSAQVEKTFTRAGEEAGTGFAKSFQKSIENSPQIAKSFDKAADAAGKLRVEEQKLNELREKGTGGAKLIAQAERAEKALRDQNRAVKETAVALEAANVSAGGFMSTLTNLSAGTRFGGIISSADTLAGKFGGVGLAAGGAIAGVAAIGVAAVAVGKQLYDLGSMWDSVSDGIIARTGAVGDRLTSIMDQVQSVARTTAASIPEIGAIAGQAVSSLHLSGQQLGEMTKQIADLNELTGEQTNIRQLGLVFRMFNVDAKDQSATLDGLYSTFQKTGIPVNELINTLSTSGPVLSEFGMSIDKAAGFVSVLEEAGVPADAALKGLKTTFKQLADAGKDPTQGLKDMVTQIRGLIEAGNEADARKLAENYFGSKAAPAFLAAIRDGRIDLEALPGLIDDTGHSIDNTIKKTEDFAEQWKKFKNQLEVDLKPAADSFFSLMNTQMESMLDLTHKFSEAWRDWANSDFLGPNTGFGKAWAAIKGLFTGNFPTLANTGYSGSDADLLGSVKPGRYLNANEDQGQADLTKGLGDCSSAIEDLINIMDGQPTAGRSMSTANADSWLAARGFMPTDELVPGAFNVGFNDHHMQATLPGGTNFNWGSDEAAAANGVNGGGAFDPTQGFTKHYYRRTEVKPDETAGVDSGAGHGGASGRQHRGLPAAGVAPGLVPGAPVPIAGPAVTDFNPPAFPSAGDVGPSSTTSTPVPMMPNPLGPGYAPIPAGSTPGYNDTGKAGYYLPDQKQIASQSQRYTDAQQRILDANDAIADAKDRERKAAQDAADAAENDSLSDEQKAEKQRAAARAVRDTAKAKENADRAVQDAEAAQQDLADAKRGTFREMQKAAQVKSGGLDGVGASMASDFGLSEGLPGIAKWLTTFAANMAFAPMVGQLSAISASSATKGGSGLLGIMGAQNMAKGLSPLGLSGPVAGPGTGTSDSIPARLSNGEYVMSADATNNIGVDNLNAMNTPGYAEGGPVSDTASMPASGSGGGGGFAGLGGLPLQAAMTATAGLDMLAPGAGEAAQIGIQLANRAAGYAGQLAGIGVGGLLETLLPHDSPLADPGKSWVGKIASGFAGARPALPNQAGVLGAGMQPDFAALQPAPPQTPEQAAALASQHNGSGQPPGPAVHVENLINNTPDGGQTVANQIARHGQLAYSAGKGR